jgi:ParB family chromosome partitioning protein
MAKSSKPKPKSSRKSPGPAINLAAATSIPLSRLALSPANVRQTKATLSIDALAESIARRSLLQSLSVRPVLDESGAETGRYEIQAGGRRYRALQLLVAQKRLDPDAPIPCIIKTSGLAEDDSLAENSDREALHPLDQFRAFQVLRERGLSEDEIAAAYAVTPAVVRQRLRLATASPVLLEAYAQDEVRLETLMAFCLSEDHARQEQLWGMIQAGQLCAQPYAIKRLLTEDKVEADDKRALFVGQEAYIAAGGTISRDLFDEEYEGYFDDPALLNTLASEKLAAACTALLSEGWKWAEGTLESPYAIRSRLRRLPAEQPPLTQDEQTAYDVLSAQYDALIEEYDEDAEDFDAQRAQLESIEAQIAAIDDRPPLFDEADKARAGVLLSISHEGKVSIDYGLLRPVDDTVTEDGTADSEHEGGGGMCDSHGETMGSNSSSSAAPDEDDRVSPKLIHDLTAYRTTALQQRLSEEPEIALVAVLHAMVLSVFYSKCVATCLQITVSPYTSRLVPELDDWKPTSALQAAHDGFAAQLPDHPAKLWSHLLTTTADDRAALLAYCAARSIKAVREPHAYGAQRSLMQANQLAATLALDMGAAGFEPTVENYFGRITKAQIIESVREARGSSTAQLIDHLKKPDMAKEAARLVQGTGWLPPILRGETVSRSESSSEPETSPAALPAFLMDPASESAAA